MAPKYILEQFLQQELLINITEHEVGPWELGAEGGLVAGVGEAEWASLSEACPQQPPHPAPAHLGLRDQGWEQESLSSLGSLDPMLPAWQREL